MNSKLEIGRRLRHLRGSRTKDEVARSLNVSVITLSAWERGERIPSDTMKIKISLYYNRPVTSLFFRSSEPDPGKAVDNGKACSRDQEA